MLQGVTRAKGISVRRLFLNHNIFFPGSSRKYVLNFLPSFFLLLSDLSLGTFRLEQLSELSMINSTVVYEMNTIRSVVVRQMRFSWLIGLGFGLSCILRLFCRGGELPCAYLYFSAKHTGTY